MKKTLALVLVLLMSFGACALAKEENWYLETAQELAQCVGELAGDEGYQEMVGYSDNAYIEAFHDAGCEELQAAYSLKIPINALLLAMRIGDMSAETEAGKEAMKVRLMGALATMVNSRVADEALVATTILSFSRTYSVPESFETQIIALDFGETAIAVCFIQTGVDTITATAQPLFFRDENPLESLFETMKSAGISIEKVL